MENNTKTHSKCEVNTLAQLLLFFNDKKHEIKSDSECYGDKCPNYNECRQTIIDKLIKDIRFM